MEIQLASGGSPEANALMAYLMVLGAVAWMDIRKRIIPNFVLLMGLPVAFLVGAFSPGIGWASALMGMAAGFGLMLALYLLSRKGTGGGDVKLAALIGAAAGFPGVLAALSLAFLLAAPVSIALVVARKKTTLPFGAFMAAGAIGVLFWGQVIEKSGLFRVIYG